MKVEVQIDESYEEPKVIIVTKQVTKEIQELLHVFSSANTRLLMGFQGEVAQILEPENIYRIYSTMGKVVAETEKGEYRLRFRLYELEERLESQNFVRISNSEIINLKKVKEFDLSLTGTIRVSLKNGRVAYVSRRFVSKIKTLLGI